MLEDVEKIRNKLHEIIKSLDDIHNMPMELYIQWVNFMKIECESLKKSLKSIGVEL